MDVPETAVAIYYGALLRGQGKMYVDDLHLRIVDHSVPVTAVPWRPVSASVSAHAVQSRSLAEPRNVDFEVTIHRVSGVALGQ